MAMVVREHRVNFLLLWFGFLGAPLAWSIHELVSLAMVSYYCYPMGEPLPHPFLDGVWVTDLCINIFLALVAAASFFVAFRVWRSYQAAEGAGWRQEMLDVTRGGAYRYLAYSGILFGVIFFSAIAYSLIALFIVPICGYH